jgi:hypothetical protein
LIFKNDGCSFRSALIIIRGAYATEKPSFPFAFAKRSFYTALEAYFFFDFRKVFSAIIAYFVSYIAYILTKSASLGKEKGKN